MTHHLSIGSAEPPLVHGKLRLYSMRFCPYSQRIHLVLDAKKISYDVVYVNMLVQPEWFSSKSMGKVPCIELEDGDTLYDSLIIAEYLDDRYPEVKLYSSNPLVKAKDKLLLEQFHDISRMIYKLQMRVESNRQLFDMFLNKLEIYEFVLNLRRTSFFGGDEPGMVDYMIWPWCERIDVIRLLRGSDFVLPRGRFARLLEWQTAMKNHPVVKISYQRPLRHFRYICSCTNGTAQYDF